MDTRHSSIGSRSAVPKPETRTRVRGTPQLDALPDKYFNEEGDLDLSKVTGKEAAAYLGAIGW